MTEYMSELARMQNEVLNRALVQQKIVHEKYDEKYKMKYLINKDGSEKEVIKYEKGAYVLSTLDRNSKPTDKLAPLKYGPYEVIEVMDNDKYIVKDLVEDSTHTIYATYLCPYRWDINDKSPEEISARDTEDVQVDAILDFSPLKLPVASRPTVRDFEYMVQFDDNERRWISYNEVSKLRYLFPTFRQEVMGAEYPSMRLRDTEYDRINRSGTQAEQIQRSNNRHKRVQDRQGKREELFMSSDQL